MSRFDVVKGVDVSLDWDNFLWNKLSDYYVVQEKLSGTYFSIASDGTVVIDDSESTKLDLFVNEVSESKLVEIVKLTKNLVVTFVIVGKDFSENPYNLEENKIFVVDVFNSSRGMALSSQELIKFVEMINVNGYGKTYNIAEIMGLVEFKEAIKKIKELPDDTYTDDIELGILDSFNALLQTPSCANPLVQKKALTFSGLFGYTFFYK